ncbi:YihY/virulence factor BrkB family protein [Caulobacter sp. 17J80-11]|uniref:YihY/virulence factor BrkB family protein n=1 Tax=Caulobacter sp. 17J80-11 TaxID=2763502 RepID=UPI001653C109|nr:YihY/virulence factor BrkB family protein [Caulobacter sp. 17J80-11]MBC6980797.1 YihY/virulence factor BrkB family protein [Caulobacter sp. 17J80-11]
MGRPSFPPSAPVRLLDVAAAAALTLVADRLWLRWREGGRRAPARSTGPGVDAPGRRARKPTAIPPGGWKDVLWRTFQEIREDEIIAVAGGAAYAAVLGVFPAMAAFVALYGLFFDVADVRAQLGVLAGVIPADVLALIGEQMVRIATRGHGSLGLAFAGGLLLSLWSASAGVRAMIRGLNIAYDETETRGFVRVTLLSLGFTLAAVIFLIVASAAVVVLPLVLSVLGLQNAPLAMLRWPVLLAVVLLGLAVLYRYGPDRAHARWRWVTPGSLAATALWVLGSMALSWYLAHVVDYRTTYGPLGAMFGLLTWLWLSVLFVLAGAELNAEVERQTAVDSTTGPPQPLGARGAVAADTLGRRAPSRLKAWLRKPPDAP